MPVCRDFRQITWDQQLIDDCRQLVRLAVREDLDRQYDLTTISLVPADRQGRAVIAVRSAGVICGLKAAQVALDEMEIEAEWETLFEDGQAVPAGTAVASIQAPARDLLTAERTVLNLVGRLSGIATLTSHFVSRVAGTAARIYDTRKTTPGMRRLEKYAVRCGGGNNHRTGLFDAVLIKDNHLAFMAESASPDSSAAEAVRLARKQLKKLLPVQSPQTLVEVEVDSLEQLKQVLPEDPDIVLLDNMSIAELQSAVAMRNAGYSDTQLEASGGVTFDSIREIARTGVERISVGALTHSATSLDIGLDWESSDSKLPRRLS